MTARKFKDVSLRWQLATNSAPPVDDILAIGIVKILSQIKRSGLRHHACQYPHDGPILSGTYLCSDFRISKTGSSFLFNG